MRVRFLIATVVLFASVEAFGATVQADEATFEAPVSLAGTVWLNNPYGSIDVVGGEGDKVVITVQRIINAMNEQALKEAKEIVTTSFEGDARVRLVKTNFPEPRDPRWTAIVNYNVRVPRSVHLKIGGRAMDHIRVSQILGNVTISAVSGTIMLSNLGGASTVDTINGRVIYDYPDRPVGNARVQAINADIDIYAPRESMFDWVAETLKGDLLTTFDIRGLFNGNVYHGRTSNGGGPTLTTSTLSGRVMLLVKGTSPQQARRVTRQQVNAPQGGGNRIVLPPVRKVQIPFIYSTLWEFAADVADVSVGEIHGSTRIQTGAGEVELGVVYGTAVVNSRGGPLSFGDMMGPIDVHTDAGDVTIRVSRQGGSASTEGGSVKVLYAGGPMNLRSGGGDIVVQQANAAIDAATHSGDISLTLSPLLKTQHVSAKTSQGNITLIVNPNFAADIDAILVTNDGDANRIHSDFNLTFRREAYNGKTRIRATGKINGGGERVELVAEDGSINISSQVVSPMVIASPRQ
jgi:DUF4097 and DUF4098 domain-containing protein YvlB